MAFTYSAAVDTDLAKVRLAIGDTDSTTNAGVKPDGTNFTDAELNSYITLAGSWQKAVPQVLMMLANAYAIKARSLTIGDYSEGLQLIATELRNQAQEWSKHIAGEWSGLTSYHGTDDVGDDIGHVFGKKQWGASPEDFGE